MALIQCPECDREISDNAEACPGCGVPIAKRPPAATAEVQVKRGGGAWEALGFLIIVCAIFYGGMASDATTATFIGVAGFVVFLIGRFK